MSDPNLSDELLDLLRCPTTQQKLHPATANELAALGIDFPEGGFLTEDQALAYPIENGLPVLKPEEGVRPPLPKTP